jgi:hypothetical protein
VQPHNLQSLRQDHLARMRHARGPRSCRHPGNRALRLRARSGASRALVSTYAASQRTLTASSTLAPLRPDVLTPRHG